MGAISELSTLKFVIIAGTSKAGTTSVFNYLAGHPEICPADKETRFFLDADYPLSSARRFQKDGAAAYLSLFDAKDRQASGNWRFEATPDYLYSRNTADVIRETLPNVRLIFILREPVSRLISWYRFAKKRSELPSRMTFDRYVEMQKNNDCESVAGAKHPAFCALQHGRYSMYLKKYIKVFGKSSVTVMFYEQLRSDPEGFMVSLCRSLCIDHSYFAGYRYDVVNKGSDVRNRYLHRLYMGGDQGLRRRLRHNRKLRSVLRWVRPGIDLAYAKLNVRRPGELVVSKEVQVYLESYYRDEPERLADMLGLQIPWKAGKA